MAINKVQLYDDTLIDLTQDTVTEDTLLFDTTAHKANGEIITGQDNPGFRFKCIAFTLGNETQTIEAGQTLYYNFTWNPNASTNENGWTRCMILDSFAVMYDSSLEKPTYEQIADFPDLQTVCTAIYLYSDQPHKRKFQVQISNFTNEAVNVNRIYMTVLLLKNGWDINYSLRVVE